MVAHGIALMVSAFALAGAAVAGPEAPPERPLRVAQADAAEAPRWAALAADERDVLAPLKQSWDTMEPESRLKWQQIARRFPNMPAARQERVRNRMNSWAQLTPEQRIEARQTFQRAKALTRDERRAQWDAYQALSPEEKAALLAQHPAGRGPGNRGPGATTRVPGQAAEPAPHLQSGMPRINVMPGMVDPTTLLPLRGPQGAAQVRPQQDRPAKPAPKPNANPPSAQK